MVKHKLLKNIHVHTLNLLNFVYIVVFDVEIAIENAKLVILERLVLKMFSTPSQLCWGEIRIFFLIKFSSILQKPKCLP